MDKIENINIRNESTDDEVRYQFYVGECRRGLVTLGKDGRVKFHWQTAGPSNLEESRIWIQGLLELSMIAEQLELEARHGKKTTKRRRK
jgi:hypothetical protein